MTKTRVGAALELMGSVIRYPPQTHRLQPI
jgi:hypothetical protein